MHLCQQASDIVYYSEPGYSYNPAPDHRYTVSTPLRLWSQEIDYSQERRYCWCFRFLIASAAAFSTSLCPFSSTGES